MREPNGWWGNNSSAARLGARYSYGWRRAWLWGVMASLMFSCGDPPPAAETPKTAEPRPSTSLPSPGEPAPIGGGESRFVELDLLAGHFLHLEVEQRGIDLTLELKNPAGQILTKIDSPNGAWGPEEIILLVPESGRFRLEVKGPSKAGTSGELSWKLVASRTPTARDRELVAAEGAYRAGLAERRAGRPAQAFDPFRRAFEGFTKLKLRRRQADVLQGLYRAHLNLGQTELAASFAEQAAELFEAEGNFRLAAELGREGGQVRIGLGQLRTAADRLMRAIAHFHSLADPIGEARSLGLLAATYVGRGELQQGLSTFEKAFEVLKQQPEESTEAVLLSDYAVLLLDLNQPQKAARAYLRASEIHRRQGRTDLLAIALRGIAEARALAGEKAEAEPAMAEALRLERELPAGRNLAVALHAAGRIRHLAGDSAGAEEALREALTLTAKFPDAKTEALVHLDLGFVLLRTGRVEEALAIEDRARLLFAATGDDKGQASAVVRGAEALLELGRPREAWKRLEPALSVVERLRASTVRRDYRASYFAHWQHYYELAIETLSRCHQQEPRGGYERLAWAVHEGRLARELEAARREPPDGRSPALLARERELTSKLSEAALLANRELREERVESLLADLYRVRSSIPQDREGSLEGVTQWRPEDLLSRVRKELTSPETLLLVFSLGEARSHLWSITPYTITLHSLPPRADIEPRVREFVAKLREPRRSSRPREARLGRGLSDLLLGPVAALLESQRLLVVADGALQELPWAVLPIPGSVGEDRALITAHELVTLPAARVLLDLRDPAARRESSRRDLALFFDPVFSSADPRLDPQGRQVEAGPAAASHEAIPASRELRRSAKGLRVDPEARLPETQAEAASILSLAPPGPHLVASGFEANRDVLFSATLERFGVIHFATHALLDRAEPELSGIVLSRLDAQGRPIDGFVRAFEISRLRLAGSLVVLSACESGVGRDLKGEGVQSLLRAFFEAGAGGVIASFWPVSDRRTADLMRHFYRGFLQDGLSASDALRKAQLALSQHADSADPYYWAGFYYQGDQQVW